ncbi:cation:proton antiporter [Mangrovibacterium diazotrophicum]|uniref:Transporter (CPA2 family) n=1 Tax=Mangrovibacterium diazotrophicum TaxID=1261403 RepID=A0A419W6U8_9BACT|nr:cation:proton antiporter [Mangrovibacterium diazotrophicum]RKD91175.1 transporter (CPA2 family) [Mangrovibacterium diazotrophicum]
MNVVLSVGVLIFTGYILGELAGKVKLPKISGYILAGILLNPDLSGIMSSDFVDHTDPLLSISLSFITFSIGGSLSAQKLKATGKTVFSLTLLESLFAFASTFIFIFLALQFIIPRFESVYIALAVSLVLASLAAPTDPSATLAVIHEYQAKGEVSSTMLEIAAFDDLVGIVIYTLVTSFATFFLGKNSLEFGDVMQELGKGIGGALLIGTLIGLLFNFVVKIFTKQPEGTLIVLTFGLVSLSYGISEYLGFESLLSTMALGAVVANLNPIADKIFKLIERYTDELIFVVFFTLSGLHLQLSSITGSFLLIVIYIVARAIGKFGGIYTGGLFFNLSPNVKKYTGGGLLPQGGIVIGLALLLTKQDGFKDTASMIMGIVIGAALIHEIIGPIASRYSLKKAGEIE